MAFRKWWQAGGNHKNLEEWLPEGAVGRGGMVRAGGIQLKRKGKQRPSVMVMVFYSHADGGHTGVQFAILYTI